MTIKVAGLELSVQDAAKGLGRDMANIQERMSQLENRFSGGALPANTATAAAELARKPNKRSALLWVDDYPSNNAFLIEGLKHKGIEVVLSLSTEDAVRKLRDDDYKAIITDLGRVEDGRDNAFAGLDLIRQLRADGTLKPTLVFAGSRGIANRDKLLKAGAEDVTDSGIDVMAFIDKYFG